MVDALAVGQGAVRASRACFITFYTTLLAGLASTAHLVVGDDFSFALALGHSSRSQGHCHLAPVAKGTKYVRISIAEFARFTRTSQMGVEARDKTSLKINSYRVRRPS